MNVPHVSSLRFSAIYTRPVQNDFLNPDNIDSLIRIVAGMMPDKFKELSVAEQDELKKVMRESVKGGREKLSEEMPKMYRDNYQVPVDKLDTVRDSVTIGFNQFKAGDKLGTYILLPSPNHLLTEDDAKAFKEWLAARQKKA